MDAVVERKWWKEYEVIYARRAVLTMSEYHPHLGMAK